MAVTYSGNTTLTTSGPAAGGYDIGITGAGSLLVNGGSTEVWGNGSTQDPFGRLGVSPGADGSILVTGNFSRLILDGIGGDTGLHVGSQGTGTLDVEKGGEFVIENAITATGTTSAGISVGRFAGATGTVNVTDATMTFDAYATYFNVGRDGGTGDANFSNATVNFTSANSSGFQIGRGSGSVGTMDLTAGTVMTLGSGNLAGAQDQFAGSTFNIGRDGGSGTLTIDASTLTLNDTVDAADATDFFSTGGQIGRGGTGTVNLANGATWSMISANSDAFLRIGRDAGGDGTLDIDATSTFSMVGGNGSDLQIGRDGGVGRMDVAGTAVVDAVGGFATMTVGRTNGIATLDVAGLLDMDAAQGAFLTIGETGATGAGTVTGTIDIDGTNGAEIVVGRGGAGTLDIGAGGAAEIATGTNRASLVVGSGIGGDATLNLAANGTVDVTSDDQARFAIGINGGGTGTATLNGDVLVEGTGNSAGMNVGINGGDGTVDIQSGTVTISGPSAFVFMGNDFGSGAGTATIDVASGATLALAGDNVGPQIGGNSSQATMNVDGTLSADGTQRSAVSVGVDGADGTLNVTGTIDVDSDADASLDVGVNGGTGTLNASGATITLDGGASTGFTGFVLGLDFGGGPGTGTVRLENGSTLSVAGFNAFSDVAASDNSSGTLDVLSGSTVSSTGGLGIGIDGLDATARVTIDGAGSAVTLGDNVGVGYGSFNGIGTSDAELRVTDGGAITANGIFAEQGGRIVAGNATLDAAATTNIATGGAFTALATGPVTVRGDLNFLEDSSLTVRIAGAASAGRIVVDGGFAFVNAGTAVTFDASAYTFTGGETYTYTTAINGGSVDQDVDVADITVTGQSANFGFLLYGTATSETFEALTDGAGTQTAVLDFGATSGLGATFAYAEAVGGGEGAGGDFADGVTGFNLDIVAGTAGNDTFSVTGSRAIVLFGRGGNDQLTGGAADDTIEGGAGADTINGGAGFDRASYSGSNAGVRVDLQAGTATGGHAAGDNLSFVEDLTGSAFADQLTGDALANDLDGGGGNDILRGGGGADRLDGGAGADILFGGAGGDVIIGGAGFDFVSYTDAATGITLDLLDAGANAGDAAGDALFQVENLVGSQLADTIRGGNVANNILGRGGDDVIDGRGGADVLKGEGGDDELIGGAGLDRLEGGGGNDVLRGGADDDELFGGAGADILFGDGGADLLDGGTGFDFVSYTASTSGIVLDAKAPGTNAGDAAGDVLVRIENLVGSNFADTISGGNVANQIFGRNGADVIDGRGGADLIDGGGGADTLTGGAGFDTFRYRLTGESTAAARDTITDFANGQDTIDLSAIDADTGAAGNQAFAFIGKAGFSGTAGELRYGTAGGNATLIGDTDGDGSADLVIALDGIISLSAGDFVL